MVWEDADYRETRLTSVRDLYGVIEAYSARNSPQKHSVLDRSRFRSNETRDPIRDTWFMVNEDANLIRKLKCLKSFEIITFPNVAIVFDALGMCT